jgi:PqqD family protein of HPr-rel-A system
LKKIEFNGECVLYNCKSGETHFLNESALLILLIIINDSPMSMNQLMDELRNVYGVSETDLHSHVSLFLICFVDLGIICSSSAPTA